MPDVEKIRALFLRTFALRARFHHGFTAGATRLGLGRTLARGLFGFGGHALTMVARGPPRNRGARHAGIGK